MSTERWSVYALTVALNVIGGFAFGTSLRLEVGGTLLSLIGLAAFSYASRSPTSPLSILLFCTTAGFASSPWIPNALERLGSTPTEAYAGWIAAVIWSGWLHLVPTCLLLLAAQRLTPRFELLVAPIGVFLAESLVVRIPSAVPWTLLGFPLIDSSGIAQLASIGGVPLVSATGATTALAIIRLTESFKAGTIDRAVPTAVLAGVIALAATGEPVARRFAGPTRPGSDAPSTLYLGIQPNLPRAERLRPSLQRLNLERLERLTEHATRIHGSLEGVAVWPENALFDPDDSEPGEATRLVEEASERLGIHIVAGITEKHVVASQNHQTSINSVVSIRPDVGEVGRVAKNRAVPVLERSGGRLEAVVARSVGAAGAWEKVAESESMSNQMGLEAQATALCFEILFPQIVDARRGNHAAIILNPADDSWVDGTLASRQLTQIARFRAIEQRLPLMRVAHGGLSATFDAFGQLIEELPPDRPGVIQLEVFPNQEPPFVSQLTILVLPLTASLVVGWAVATRERRAPGPSAPPETN